MSAYKKPFEIVRAHLIENNIPFFGNHNISEALQATGISKEDLIEEVAARMKGVLESLCIDVAHDHNSKGTALRFAKMVINETMSGRFDAEPSITEFPNASNLDQLISVSGLRVESMCSHHLQNIRGVAHIAVLPHPEGRVIGLSKFSRILRHFAKRPQIQEELTVQVSQYLQEKLQPLGVAVLIEAEHQCMACRGVEEPGAITSTTHLTGMFLESPSLRQEWLAAIAKKRLS